MSIQDKANKLAQVTLDNYRSKLLAICEAGAQEDTDRLMAWQAKIVDAGPNADQDTLDKARRNLPFLRGCVDAWDRMAILLRQAE